MDRSVDMRPVRFNVAVVASMFSLTPLRNCPEHSARIGQRRNGAGATLRWVNQPKSYSADELMFEEIIRSGELQRGGSEPPLRRGRASQAERCRWRRPRRPLRG